MRKIFFATVAAGLFSCTGMAQNKHETIEGNGKSVTRDVAVQSFAGLQASGIYELTLTQGNTEGVRIEADENLQEYFTVRNEGNKLVIDMKKLNNKNLNLKSKNKLKVHVTFKKLNELDLSTIGDVRSNETLAFDNLDLENKSVGNVNLKFTANKVDIKNSSVGNVTLAGKAQSAVVKNSGVGSLHAADFEVQNLNIDNNGVGNAEVNAIKELKVSDNMMGKVRNRGGAAVRKMGRVRI